METVGLIRTVTNEDETTTEYWYNNAKDGEVNFGTSALTTEINWDEVIVAENGVLTVDTNVDVSCIVETGNAVAEAGGLVALNNRGLVAHCYTLGDVYGSASRNNGDEGMASVSALVGVQAGGLVDCYSMGNHTTGELSYYCGTVAGWVTGIGKAYDCRYNSESVMKIGTQTVNPVESIGTKVAGGVNEDGDAYVGGLID